MLKTMNYELWTMNYELWTIKAPPHIRRAYGRTDAV